MIFTPSVSCNPANVPLESLLVVVMAKKSQGAKTRYYIHKPSEILVTFEYV